MNTLNKAWLDSLTQILMFGDEVSPRGAKTKEILHRTMLVDMRQPVLTLPTRRLNYKFMAAEALWILSGDDRVETIAPYNKRIADFSDDGQTFFGAYGPKIKAQLPYVIEKLLADPMSRQAGLTIWRESPPATKDVPCTIAMFFNIRSGLLNTSVFMRSSDAWLGVPYDVFSFSMLSYLICGKLKDVEPGTLHLTAASSHLYESNWDGAITCIREDSKLVMGPLGPEPPPTLWRDPWALVSTLGRLRDTSPGDPLRWWEALDV